MATEQGGGVLDKGLKAGAIGLVSTIVIGVASTAPGYSLAASLGFVTESSGAQAPAVLWLAFVPMLFIAYAYRELNNEVPDCGTTFTWGTKAFGPWVGWLGGWGVAVAGMVVLANLAQIGGIYFWALVDGIVGSGERKRQYVAGIVVGLLSIMFGLFAPTFTRLLLNTPKSFVAALAGLAMLSVLQTTFVTAFANRFSFGALVAFLVTIADMPLLNVGAPFWGLVSGIVISVLLERADFASRPMS